MQFSTFRHCAPTRWLRQEILARAASLRRSVIGIATLALVCGISVPPSAAQDAVVLVGAGSSVPAPLYLKWADEYNKRSAATQMRYMPIGTGEGIKQISHGSGDFAAGEVALTTEQRAESNLIELPSLLIGIVPYYNIPGVHEDLRFNGEVLADIFLGKVKNWNSAAIAKLNPDAQLPDMSIQVVFRPGGKGTNYVFTDFLSKTSSRFKSEIGVTASPSWPLGTPAERSSDMVDKVKSTPGAMGYGELQYAVKAGIHYGSVLNPAGKYVKASPETISAACRAIEAPSWNKFGASLTNAPGEDSFPITSFTWLYLRTNATDSRRSVALSDLLTWMYSSGQQLGAQEGYNPLPPQLLEKVRAKADSLK
jgi:phosphate transport system substrate-binding protein